MDYNTIRGSVYDQPDIEGYLDKKETGVLRSKTSKKWCWVQGSIFYQQKQSTNNNVPGGVTVIDMSDAQSVRNIATDATGTQFEVFIKKSQVYVCPSREECTAWIKALQKAMVVKQSYGLNVETQGLKFCPLETEETNDIYAEIPEAGSGNQILPSGLQNGHGNTSQPHDKGLSVENIYADPQDSVENVYSLLSDDDGGKGKDEKGPSPPSLPDRHVNGSESVDCTYAEGYSTGTDSTYAEGCSTRPQENKPQSVAGNSTEAQETESKKNKYVKNVSQRGPKPTRRAPIAPHVKNETIPPTSPSLQAAGSPQASMESTDQRDEANNSEDQLMDIFNCMDVDSAVHDLEYIITNNDARPVCDLKTVLRQNDVHCRISTNRLSKSDDPIAACKSYLSTLKDFM